MDKKVRRQIKLPDYEPKLDIDEFNALTDLLFETTKENHALCARLCGISRITWRKWEKTPPTWPWWPLVLRAIIKHYITALHIRRGLTKKHRARIMDSLHKIPQADDFMAEIEDQAYNLSGAQAHLRRLLGVKGMFWDSIRLPAHSGGYTTRTLRSAARAIGVVKTQEGYGQHKKSYWRLPDQDDD